MSTLIDLFYLNRSEIGLIILMSILALVAYRIIYKKSAWFRDINSSDRLTTATILLSLVIFLLTNFSSKVEKLGNVKDITSYNCSLASFIARESSVNGLYSITLNRYYTETFEDLDVLRAKFGNEFVARYISYLAKIQSGNNLMTSTEQLALIPPDSTTYDISLVKHQKIDEVIKNAKDLEDTCASTTGIAILLR